MQPPTLNLVVLRSDDLDRAAAFYTAIGLRFEREHHGSGPEHLASELNGCVFEVYPAVDGTMPETRLGFRLADFDRVVTALRELDIDVPEPKSTPWGLRTVVTDPDGHRVELVAATEEG